MMKLFLVQRNDYIGYDEYDSFVALADSEETAKLMHPASLDGSWSGYVYGWTKSVDNVIVTYLGLADESLGTEQSVITNSFNAG